MNCLDCRRGFDGYSILVMGLFYLTFNYYLSILKLSMKIYCTILFIAIVKIIQAQAVELEWEKSFGGGGYEESYDLVLTLIPILL
jgi:hypothetical protein